MPTPYLEKVAKDKGKSVSEMEDLWSQAKAQAAKEGHSKDYAYITAIFKKMAGVTSSTLKVNSDVKTTSDYESIAPSNLGPLDSKTADPHNFDSQGNPIVTQKLKAVARLQTAAISHKGSKVTSAKDVSLGLGAYVSKEKPTFLSMANFYGEDDEMTGSYVAYAQSYNVNSEGSVYAWKTEKPKRLMKVSSMDDIMRRAPELFKNAGSAKYVGNMSDGETAFCYQGSGGWLVIVIDND